MKDGRITFRIDQKTKNEFMQIIDAQDKEATKVLTRFVKEYIKQNKEVLQSQE